MKAIGNPFREGSALRKIFGVLIRAGEKGAPFALISRNSHVTTDKCRNLIGALSGRWHSAKIRRLGIKVVRKGGTYMLQPCKAESKAKRPPRKKAKG